MPKVPFKEVLPANLAEHRAVKAWNTIASKPFQPERIEILKLKSRKSSVYRLTGTGNGRSTLIAKRTATGSASVERAVYEEFLPRLPLPALRCHGFAPEPDGGSSWLFFEDAGQQAYTPTSTEHRELAGRWAATVHCTPVASALRACLPDRGPAHYLSLLRASRATLRAQFGNPVLTAEDAAVFRIIASHCDVMEAHWDDLEEFFARWPASVVHGDFVIKNLRIRNGACEPALLVYDWEMAGWGVPAADLAQSIGRCVSPDLDAYGAVLRKAHPWIEACDVQRLADFGNLVRALDKIYWETLDLGGDSNRYFTHTTTTLKLEYEPQLAAAVRALNWSHHD